MNKKKTLLISIIILLVGGAVTTLIFFTEPTASRSGATKKTAMLVEVISVQRGDFQPVIKVMGNVEPTKDIVLSPRISGEIISRSEAFTPGGYVKKGEILLQVDPADYKNILQQRQSELRQAIADLNIEKGRQDVALKDYQLIGDTLSDKNKALVLRAPQLDAAKSRVEAARASVDQAKLELQRTTIRAPFDAHILSRNVNVGSQVAPGENLGRLVGLDTYWVTATVPLSKLRWLTFPGNDREKGSEVKIRNRTAWPEGAFRKGHLYKRVGTLEDQTRMARVLVTVSDPLAVHTEKEHVPELMIGSFVEAAIQAKEINDVIRLNRDYVRKEDNVWVMEEGKLRIRDVDIMFQDNKYAYIGNGLGDGAQVVTSNLTTVVDGARLRLEGSEDETNRDSLSNAME